MSIAHQAVAELQSAREFFNRSTRSLAEAHSTFAPAEGMMTAAQQVPHVAHTIDCFLEGAFRPEGFELGGAGQRRRPLYLAGAGARLVRARRRERHRQDGVPERR